MALIPEATDPDPGAAVMVVSEKPGTTSYTCNCRSYRGRTGFTRNRGTVIDRFNNDSECRKFEGRGHGH